MYKVICQGEVYDNLTEAQAEDLADELHDELRCEVKVYGDNDRLVGIYLSNSVFQKGGYYLFKVVEVYFNEVKTFEFNSYFDASEQFEESLTNESCAVLLLDVDNEVVLNHATIQ